jgi:putative restriction endonuclease
VGQWDKRDIVSGKRYDTGEPEGQMLWDEVTNRLQTTAPSDSVRDLAMSGWGAPRLIRPRLGQGAFRLAVTDAYDRRCAVSGERTLPILDAAHIHSFSEGGNHESSNGLLLRTDIHRLFDLGYVTVSPDHRFEVSRRLKADFDNGKQYYDLHGTPIRKPVPGFDNPSAQALTWHRENRFLG